MTAIIRPGQTCWQQAEARRFSWVVDGADYFRAVRHAITQARRQVFILGWDLDSRVELLRGEEAHRAGVAGQTLRDFLARCLRANRHLHIYVLLWDYTLLYALDREFSPALKLQWNTPRRLRAVSDDQVPMAGSHHQKVVVVDDRVAFVGGLDITDQRWDTPEHREDDPRRVTLWGEPYRPFHDVQAVFDGPAAQAMGDMARDRWERATGYRPPRPEGAGDAWPAGVAPAIQGADVGIARTLPRLADRPAVREVEALYLEAIRAARHFIYAENQFFASERIALALAERLAEPDGPEVVLVTSPEFVGWMEAHTMGLARRHFAAHLRAADRHGRLHFLAPWLDHSPAVELKVHSKVMVVDDRFLRIGSSNLNNRSLGYDTEADVAVADPAFLPAARQLREQLLAEHLNVRPGVITRAMADAGGSLIGAIDALRRPGGRTLIPVEQDPGEPDDPFGEIALTVADPERPVDLEDLMPSAPDLGVRQLVGAAARALRVSGGIGALGLLLLALAGTALMAGPAGDLVAVDREALVAWLTAARATVWAPLVMLGLFAASGLVPVPFTGLVIAGAVVFGPWEGLALSLGGALVGGSAGFAAGRLAGRVVFRRVAGAVAGRLGAMLGGRGVRAVWAMRAVPVAPFAVVNMAAGALSVPFSTFLIGTVLGMLPGLVLINLAGTALLNLLRRPSLAGAGVLAGLLAAWVVVGTGLDRLLHRRRAGGEAA